MKYTTHVTSLSMASDVSVAIDIMCTSPLRIFPQWFVVISTGSGRVSCHCMWPHGKACLHDIHTDMGNSIPMREPFFFLQGVWAGEQED